jgi:hypothetical protein
MNKTPDGEVFGSGDPEVNQDITMYVEQADLSKRHAMINYTDTNGRTFDDEDSANQGQYFLSDCGSDTGTWIKLCQTFAENQNDNLIDLHNALGRQFEVGPHKFSIWPDNQVSTIDEVIPWIEDFIRNQADEAELVASALSDLMMMKELSQFTSLR